MAIPSDIPGLYTWYKSGSFSLSNGDQCGNWIDSSGNGRHITVFPSGGYPKFQTNQIAGYPAILFNGVGVFSLNIGWGPSGLASHTIFAVFSSAGGGGAIYGSDGGSNSECLFHDGDELRGRTGAGGSVVGGALATGIWAYGMKSQNGATQIACSLNGGTETTGAGSASRPSGGSYIGSDGGTTWTNGSLLAECMLYDSNLSSGDKTLINNYLRDKYFGAAPGQQEQMRDVLSRRLWIRRRPDGMLEVTGPLWLLDVDVLDRIALESQVGPAPAAAGWGGKKWQRRAFSVQSIDLNPSKDGMSVKLVLLDRRPLDVLLWDTARTDKRNTSARQDGVARLTKGTGSVFARLSKAWIPNPADPTSIAECAQNERAINQQGEYLEEARTNEIARSSSVSGTTGLTLAGTGTNGSAIAADTGALFFDAATSPQSLKFTAGNPHAAELRVTYAATASILANSNVRVSIDYQNDSGAEGLFWRLTRGVDGFFWNDGSAAFQAGTVDNSMPVHSDRDPEDRYFSKKIPVGGSNTTLTLSVFYQTGGTASRISHLYHAQIEVGSFATSRIVTDGAAGTRVKTELTHDVTTALKLYDPALGGFYCELVPDWSSADLGSSEDQYVFYQETNGGADRQALYYDASAGAFVFESKVGGATVTASKTATVTRGTAVRLGARWTGADGELGLTNYTVSVFVDGVKGTDATSAAPTFTSPETLYRGSNASKALQVNGAVREVRIFPYAPTDEEMAALP